MKIIQNFHELITSYINGCWKFDVLVPEDEEYSQTNTVHDKFNTYCIY